MDTSSALRSDGNTLDCASHNDVQSTALLKRAREEQRSHTPSKRQKTGTPLHPQLWSYIFSLCLPNDLVRATQACRSFYGLLSKEESRKTVPSLDGPLARYAPSDVWQTALMGQDSTMPTSMLHLHGSELFRLLSDDRCRCCGSVRDGISLLWAFRTRACRQCIRDRTTSETDIFLSPASAVLALLPSCYMDLDNDFITCMDESRHSEQQLHQLRKVFWKSDIASIETEINHKRSLGDQAVRTTFQDLSRRRNEIMRAAVAWEVWAARGAVSRFSRARARTSILSHNENQVYDMSSVPDLALQPRSPGSAVNQSRSDTQPRQRHDAQQMRHNRRAEIEKRCMDLDPPITPQVLVFMESFQNALQIINPLTDSAWNVLKPLLIAQHAEAAQREAEARLASGSVLSERQQQDDVLRDIKDVADRNWVEAQQPIRALLSKHADDIINERWSKGTAVNDQNKALFTAQTLAEAIMSNAISGGPGTLVLDNMKWVFDNKIRPVTDPLGGTFLMCNECAGSKFKALDGVIQHYASKHTTSFSQGKTVVMWQKVAWPEQPPFKRDPIGAFDRKFDGQLQSMANISARATANSSQHLLQPPQSLLTQSTQGTGLEQNLGVATYSMSPGPFASPVSPVPNFYHNVPHPTHGTPMSGYHTPQLGLAYATGAIIPGNSSGPGSPFSGQTPVYHPGPLHGPQTPVSAGNPFAAPINIPNAFPPMWSPVTNFYQSQKNVLADIARSMWSHFSSLSSIPSSLRVYVLIHHVVSQFHSKFSNEPNLDIFSDTLTSNPSLKALKNVSNLGCKQCEIQNATKRPMSGDESSMPSGLVELYSFHSLLTHFKHVHVEFEMMNRRPTDGPYTRLNWKEDMIAMPSDEYIRSLGNTRGLTARVIDLIATHVPVIRLPMVDGQIESQRQSPTMQVARRRSAESGNSSAIDGEYDPRQPSLAAAKSEMARQLHGRRSTGSQGTRHEQSHGSRASSPTSVTDASRARLTIAPFHPGSSSIEDPRPGKHVPKESGHSRKVTYSPTVHAPVSHYRDVTVVSPRSGAVHEYVRQPYREYTQYVQIPAQGRLMSEAPPPRPPYPVDYGAYYEEAALGDREEYVLVRRGQNSRIVEYPDERYFQYVRRP